MRPYLLLSILLTCACDGTAPPNGATRHDDNGDDIADGCGAPTVVTDENAFAYTATGMFDCNDVQTWRFVVSYPAGATLRAVLDGTGTVTMNSSGPQDAELTIDGTEEYPSGNYLWVRSEDDPASAEITLRILLDSVTGDLTLNTEEAAF